MNAFIYSFHLPLFFILSGYFFKEYTSGKRFDYLKSTFNKRFFSLLVPYLTYTVINRLWQIPLNYFHQHVLYFDIQQYVLGAIVQIRNSSQYSGAVWFICWMFTTSILSACISIITKNETIRNLLHIVGFCLGCILIHNHCSLPWHLDASLVALIFLRIGYLYHMKEETIDNFLHSKIWFLLTPLFFISSTGNYIFSGNYPDMFSGFIGNPILYFIESTTGSLAIIYLSKWLINTKSMKGGGKLLLDAGKNSLTLYGLHRIPLGFFGVLYRMFLPTQTGIFQIIRGFVLMIITTLCLLPVAHVLKKSCPTLFGYKSKHVPALKSKINKKSF